jgi:hypothetical protein
LVRLSAREVPARCSGPCDGLGLLKSSANDPGAFFMRAVILLLAALVFCAGPARSADDIANAQNVIRLQEQAFSHDDASAAYSYAAPAIRQIFPEADIFMFMVRRSYAPVYRHRSFEFGEARTDGGLVAQRVHIVDENGEGWEALYTLERQADGSLKITGCTLLKAGQAV